MQAAVATDMYLKLFESYVRWLESRGSSSGWARITVVFALTAAALLNGGAVIMLIRAAGGPRILDWMARYSWVTWVAVVVCVIVHWLLGRRIPPAVARTSVPITRVWWTSYTDFHPLGGRCSLDTREHDVPENMRQENFYTFFLPAAISDRSAAINAVVAGVIAGALMTLVLGVPGVVWLLRDGGKSQTTVALCEATVILAIVTIGTA